ncbi:alpha/beta fold hydrolase [filamentous cyanobacterium LEGE 11480]|uniref:Alpha/beta fold hydrolase n=1 Tax=Romeriopsis navalis LEGE 11480 TaxID=2777977 RepID=A0A928VHJ6_9CYAN|nr:alpha/beta fold hydrolase [Romeriopsis navalis]MBE9028738.1 alpha/beta fold hydrolase [Romeriopsis navalis LEGE 11480]
MTTTAAPSQSTGQYWSWRDYQIYYVQAGQNPDKPPLLLVHGFGASTDHWKKNIAALQTEFEVWAIDLLGFGRSTKADTQYSADLWCNQLNDFINQIIKRPAVIAGNSIGGYSALATNALFPEVTAGGILLNPVGGFSDVPPPEPTAMQKTMGNTMKFLLNQDWVSWLIFKSVQNKKYIRKTLQKVYVNQAEVTDELIEDIYRPSCDPGSARTFARLFRSPKGEPADTLLKKLTNPLLIIWGEKDPWIGDARKRGAKFMQFYPTATEAYINAGHCPHDDDPKAVNDLIRSWMATI